jgi:hypothetical protein
MVEDGCRLGLRIGDTLRFTGVQRNAARSPIGSLRVWSGSADQISYAETWRIDTTTFDWEGSIKVDENGKPQAYLARRLRNRVLAGDDSVYTAADSVILVRNGRRTAERQELGRLPSPSFRSTVAFALLSQCILHRPNLELDLSRYGRLALRRISTNSVRVGNRGQLVSLFLLTSDSIATLARLWVDRDRRLFAVGLSEGVMDLVREDWVNAIPQLLHSEVRAAKTDELCAGGTGPGGCEDSEFVCRLVGGAARGGTLTLVDSHYAVKSDGLGPYVNGSGGAAIEAGGIVGVQLSRSSRNAKQRTYSVDLSHPVPGDVGVNRGIVVVDGFGRDYVPSGANYQNELSAQWYSEQDTIMHSVREMPVGSTVDALQIVMDFYIDGVLHVLQAGPQPYGHCMAAGTAVHGRATSRGTITRTAANRWTVDLPAGSVARLFENRRGDPTARDKGLYFVSLRFVVQQ